jgi:hypothetical protein
MSSRDWRKKKPLPGRPSRRKHRFFGRRDSLSTSRLCPESMRRTASWRIAMATHGRGGVARLILGSVADKVIRGGKVPVLLHRAQ